ncbi:DUF642 domain-containing protein [Photobacterium sanguinicancri]|uniref:PEP-CTERM sorting domain-containing protein n=1 Tax=Photobacterium sanguinicancri TaxID=875932 RepID=A0ABX4G277_9GAMM|nr:DUF642 domain-containing protein [Photobacterium sanguinicancri]OZS45189.1 PEP-CTERM sorting domain-containing protein [Photobacterium sanguinicancri]
MVRSTLLRITVTFLLALFSITSQANLITNGSFEDIDVPNNSWRFYSQGTPNLAWQGSNVEIWDSLFGFEASEGEQYAELNAHPNQGIFSINQTFNTITGGIYNLSFDYSARRNNRNEQFEVSAGDFTQILSSNVRFNWNDFATEFTALNNSTTLTFTSLNRGTLGNLLDNVVVTTSRLPIPEPDLIFPLILLIAFALFRYQYHRARKSHRFNR